MTEKLGQQDHSQNLCARGWSTWLSWVFLAGLLGFYIAIQGWILKASNFYAFLNDFWFLRQLGDRFTGLNPGALQDGFFPYLYPLLQKALPETVALQVSATASLVFAVAVVLIIYVAASRMVGPAWALVAAWITAFQPDFFTYATVAGSDMLSAVPVAVALLLLVLWCSGRYRANPWILFWSGLLMAVGGSLRHHVLLLATIPLIAAVQVSGARLKSLLVVLAGIFVGYLPQMAVNVADGYAPYTTLQGFNIYRVVVGVDWNTTASLDPEVYSSPIRIIAGYPYEFATAYLAAWQNFTFPLVVIAAAAVLAHRTQWRRLGWASLLGAVLYAGATSLAYSGRSLIVLVPVWALAAAMTLGMGASLLTSIAPRCLTLAGPRAWPAALLAGSLLLWGTLPWLQTMVTTGRDRIALEDIRQKQESAFLEFTDLQSMSQVFSNDFNFYTLAVPGAVPRVLGGIAAISQLGDEETLVLNTKDLDHFLCSMQQQEMTRILWRIGAGSGYGTDIQEALDGIEEDVRMPMEPLGDGLSLGILKDEPVCTSGTSQDFVQSSDERSEETSPLGLGVGVGALGFVAM